jgi:hypothetical protein
MAADESRAPALREIREIDRLCRGFPDFASWARLGPAHRDLWERFAEKVGSLEAYR